ncbi:MAG: sulfatase-like hydrolase/transferase [Verrucomicrobiota bacterium]
MPAMRIRLPISMFRFIAFALFSAGLFTGASAVDKSKPNVIVIMADDIGAEGLESYGSTIFTSPNLTRMAEEGIQFQNAYATPLCTPTRVMIMTGTYPHRNGFGALMSKKPGARMPADIPTFGHYFQKAGYKTAIAGKWQLGKFDAFPGQPAEHGFDRYCMWTWFYNGKKDSRFYKPHIHVDGEFFQGSEADFGPDTYCDFVLDFIDENKDEPFFIYFPMALVHSPFIHPPRLEEKASAKFTEDLSKQTRAFGHMITYMDDIIGQILERLKASGIDENSLVMFTGDNGTGKQIVSKLPGMSLQGQKGSPVEAGSRVPLIVRWPAKIEPSVSEEFFCLVDVLPTIASVVGIELTAEVDGMDLSHYFVGQDGEDREYIVMPYKGFYVRDKRFRLHADGRMFDIPVTSDQERYSEKETTNPEHEPERERLQALIDQYQSQPALYEGSVTVEGFEEPGLAEEQQKKADEKAAKKEAKRVEKKMEGEET